MQPCCGACPHPLSNEQAGGELFDHIAMAEQLREGEARAIFRQVAAGVAHLHSLGIAHRDLKPQNLMYISADEGAQARHQHCWRQLLA